MHNCAEGFDKGRCVLALEGVPTHADPSPADLDRVADDLEGLEVAGLLAAGNEDGYRAGFDDLPECLGAARVVGLDHVRAELFGNPDSVTY